MTDDARIHSLDAVRAGALLLGIVLHATMSFLPGFGAVGWPIADSSPSATLGVTFYVLHIFRMTVFFLIAGFFARLMFQRLGQRGFIQNRLRRIALPLPVFYLLVMPLCIAPIIWAAMQLGIKGPPPATMTPPVERGLPLGHLWFLYLLLLFYTIVLITRTVIVRLDGNGTLRSAVDRLLAGAMQLRLVPLLLAAPLCVLFYSTPWWIQWMGIPSPIAGLKPNHLALAAFGTAVFVGWFIHRQQSLLQLMRRDWVFYAALAIAFTGVALYLIGARPQFQSVAQTPTERWLYAGAYMLAVWCWTFALLGAALTLLAAPSARWRYLADSSYWIYIVHLPIVWGLQAWMMRWPLHWAVKFPLILAIATVLLLASYHYLVRGTFIGKFLNGRKYPRSKPAVLVGAESH